MANDVSAINCRVPAVVHQGLTKMAEKAGMACSTYAATLLLAAYSARVKPPTGDRDLDVAVARVVMLWPCQDTTSIAAAVGLHESTVVKIIDAWRADLLMRTA